MNSSLTALLAALAAATGWTLKAVAIGVAGGLDRSPLEGPLFLSGLTFFTVGVVALGVALARGRALGWRLLGAALALPAGFAVGAAVDLVVSAVQPSGATHWVWSEVGLWAIALVLLACTATLHRRRGGALPAQA